MDRFRHPRNVGEVEDADGIGKVVNPVCGDVLLLSIKVEGNKLVDIKFKTFGCGPAIAASSIITEIASGMTAEDALRITELDVVDAHDGLPPIKGHCSKLAADGLREAIVDYMRSNEITPPDWVK